MNAVVKNVKENISAAKEREKYEEEQKKKKIRLKEKKKREAKKRHTKLVSDIRTLIDSCPRSSNKLAEQIIKAVRNVPLES
jgi:hypothetical protein